MDLAISHLGLSLLAGSLTTLSPCVFPILPMVLGGAAQGNRLAPLAMGLGMATGADKWLEAQVVGRLPDMWLR